MPEDARSAVVRATVYQRLCGALVAAKLGFDGDLEITAFDAIVRLRNIFTGCQLLNLFRQFSRVLIGPLRHDLFNGGSWQGIKKRPQDLLGRGVDVDLRGLG